MARIGKQKLMQGLISSVYNSAIQQQQAQLQAQMQKPALDSGMTKAQIEQIYNSAIAGNNQPAPQTSEIPKLEDNTVNPVQNTATPTIADELERMRKVKAENKPLSESEQRAVDMYLSDLERASAPDYKPDYKAEIDRMKALDNDETVNWSEGEKKAREDYLARLQSAYEDEQKKNTPVPVRSTVTNKSVKTPSKQKKEEKLTEESVKKDQTNFTKTMSANEKRDYDRAMKAISQAKGRALSANEQRDMERAMSAIEKAKQTTEEGSKNLEEQYADIPEFGELNKLVRTTPTPTPTPKTAEEMILNPDEIVQPKKDFSNVNFDAVVDTIGMSGFPALERPTYDEKGYRKNNVEESATDAIFNKYHIPYSNRETLGEDLIKYNTWRGSQSDLSGVNPIASIAASNIGKELQDKYGLDEKTLNQLANDYKYYESTEEGIEKAEKAKRYGEEHPIKGSINSINTGLVSSAFAPMQIADDLSNYVYNGQQASPYEGGHYFAQKKDAYREGVKENIDSNALKGAYDIGMSVADLGAASIPSMFGAPVSAPALLASQTANATSTSALERGSSPIKASAYAVASAIPDYILNTIGLDYAKGKAMDRITAEGFTKFLVQNGVAGSYEAAENAIQEGVQIAFDELINGENSESRISYANRIANGEDPQEALWNVVGERAMQVGMSALTGFAMGSAMQGAKTVSNELDATLFNKLINENSDSFTDKFNDWKANKNNPDIPRVEEQNPLEIARQNEDISNVVEQSRQAADEITRLNEQIPEVLSEGITENPVENTVKTETPIEKPANETEIPNVKEPEKTMSVSDSGIPKFEDLQSTGKGFVADGKRRVITNSAVNADIITPEDIANDPELQQIANYEKHNNVHTYKQAYRDVMSSGEQLKQDYINGNRIIHSDIDVDRSMIILKNLAKQIEESDDPTKLIAERNAILNNAATNGTDAGQFIQAFAKYNNTAEDALLKATKLDIDNKKAWKSRNKKSAESNKKIAEALTKVENKSEKSTFGTIKNEAPVEPKTKAKNARIAKALADMGHKPEPTGEKTPLTHEQIKNGVIAELEKEFGSVSEKFNDTDIEYLTILAENKDIPTWKITDEIEHRLNHGKWYSLDESTVESIEKSNKLAKALDSVVGGKQLIKEPKAKEPESIYDTMKKVRNTLNDESAGIAEDFNDNDYYYIANLLQEGVPSWKLEDELQHRLEHGEWYTLDESLPDKAPVKNKQLSRMLDNVINGKQNAKEKKELTTGELLTGIKNTLNDESLGVADQFNDADYYFIGKMIEDGVPKWQIEDELKHKLEHGDWYSLDESIEEPKRTNGRLESALNRLVNDEVRPEPEPKTINELREEVRNTIANEPAGIFDDFTDEDVNYLANLMDQGATVNEIAEALDTKASTGRWGISNETQAKVNEIFDYIRQYDENSQEFVEGQAEAFRLLAEEVAPKASAIEKFDAWRYMAMLGNPKTMLRNYVGNKLVWALTGASNSIAAAMEAGVDKAYNKATGNHIRRTKAVLNPAKDRNLIKASREDGFGKRYRQFQGSKYKESSKDAILRARETFDSKPMQLMQKAVEAGVSDTNAVADKYATSLAGYLKANGYDASVFDLQNEYDSIKRAGKNRDLLPDEKARLSELQDTMNVLEDARDFALKQAEYATFHTDNAVAKWISDGIRKARNSDNLVLKGLGLIGEGVLPFKKTPANILKSGFQYSPLGAIESIAKTGKLIYENTGSRKGNLEDTYTNKKGKEVNRTFASDVIDSWSKTLTGSLLAYLGYYLYDKGVLTSSNNDEKYQDQLEGKGNYAININGHNYTLDWAAPGVMPLLLGAEIKKIRQDNAMLDKEWYESPDRILETVNAILDPMFETSMLSGVKDTLQTAANEYKYNNDNRGGGILSALAGNALTGYATQAIPTLSGQIARTVDPIRRTTDTKKEGFLGAAEKQGRKVMNKIPGLSMLNPEYRDAYGRSQQNSPFTTTEDNKLLPTLGNLAYQMFSPGYYSKENVTDADASARNAYNGLGEDGKPIRDSGVFADWKSSKKINGEKFNPEQMQTFRTAMGEANYNFRDALANNEWFNGLSATDQTDVLKSINSLSDKIGQYSVAPDTVSISGDMKEYIEAGGGQAGIEAVINAKQDKMNPYGMDADNYRELKESGEDLTPLEGYGDALEKYGLNESSATLEAYKSDKEEGLKAIADYNNAFKEADCLTDSGQPYTSESAKKAYEDGDLEEYKGYRNFIKENGISDSDDHWEKYKAEGGKEEMLERAEYDNAFKNAGMEKSYDSESAKSAYKRNQLPQYKEYRDFISEYGIEDKAEYWDDYKKYGRIKGINQSTLDLNKNIDWGDYGLSDSLATTQKYEHAKSEIKSLTPEKYASTFKKIDGRVKANGTITQDEVISYLNSISAKKDAGMEIWKAYGSDWKTIPVLQGNKWKKS